MTGEAAFERYLDALAALAPDRLGAFGMLLAADVRFADPFHDVRGREAMLGAFARMFAQLDDVRFVVAARAWRAAPVGSVGFASWTMTAVPRRFGRRPLQLSGASEIHIGGGTGEVTAHIDYWDAAAQLYERLPVLGRVLAAIRRRLGSARD